MIICRCSFFIILVAVAGAAGWFPPEALAQSETAVVETTVSTEPAPASEPTAAVVSNNALEEIGAPVRETRHGVVAEVLTGDLLIINQNGSASTVRLYGADSPEPGQKFHDEAMQFVKDACLHANVEMHILTVDSENNPVALVVNGQGESISHLMVAGGYAWWDAQNAPKDALLRKLNAEAITRGLGLYADAAALSPYDYRDSRGLTQFSYTLDKPEPPAPVASAPKEEVRSISAKGTMTENRLRPTAAPTAPKTLSIAADVGKDVDLPGLMMRHQPRIATDENGNPLGLTATDVGAIPYAAQLGFRDGDIVSRVNGIPIESEAQIMSLIPQFQNVKQFQVEVVRNGQRVTLPISVP